MAEVRDWVELRKTIRLYIIWGAVTFIDSLFLALWITIQWLVSNKVITPLKLDGIDTLILFVFQILFAISTLAPVAITIYRDIRIMLLRTQRQIRQETELGETHEPE